MGSYPTFLVNRYIELLKGRYGLDPASIGPAALDATTGEQTWRLSSYPNDRHVLRLLRVLDEVGFYNADELNDFFESRSKGWSSPFQASAGASALIGMTLAEFRNARTLMEFLNLICTRFSSFPAHRLWLEKVHGKVRLLHAFRHAEEGFTGPQAMFAMICQEMVLTFGLAPEDYEINFLKAGIRDGQGFQRLVGHAFDCWGPLSFLEFRMDPQVILNPRHNPGLEPLLGPALDGMIPRDLEGPAVSDRVQAILKDHLARLNSPPDIDRMANLLGMSRATLFRRLEEEQASFSDLLQAIRIKHAKGLLERKDLSISQVGDRLGFSSVSTFSRSFKTFAGMSPVEYRKTFQG